MSDTDELRREANHKAAQKSCKEQEKRVLDQKIERLRMARDKVYTEKWGISDLKDGVRGQEEPDQAWKGQKRNHYHDYTKNDFRGYYQAYFDDTDTMLDALIHKITELENESNDLGGTIGWLARALNSLWADIQSAVN